MKLIYSFAGVALAMEDDTVLLQMKHDHHEPERMFLGEFEGDGSVEIYAEIHHPIPEDFHDPAKHEEVHFEEPPPPPPPVVEPLTCAEEHEGDEELKLECCLQVLEEFPEDMQCLDVQNSHWDNKCNACMDDPECDSVKCRLPSMEQDRCVRNCAWEHWHFDEEAGSWLPNGHLTVDSKCLEFCQCEDAECASHGCHGAEETGMCLLDAAPDYQFPDHHDPEFWMNYDWEYNHNAAQDAGFYDCNRRQCEHVWEENWFCGQEIDWATDFAHVDVGHTESGIPITEWSYVGDGDFGCDANCEAQRACYNAEGHLPGTCDDDMEGTCGTNFLRQETCGPDADEWCYKEFWSCKWQHSTGVCNDCWMADPDLYDTCQGPAGGAHEEETYAYGDDMYTEANTGDGEEDWYGEDDWETHEDFDDYDYNYGEIFRKKAASNLKKQKAPQPASVGKTLKQTYLNDYSLQRHLKNLKAKGGNHLEAFLKTSGIGQIMQ